MKRNVPVSRIMTTEPATVHVGQKLSEARAALGEGGFHHLPVVRGREVVGMISSVDLLRVTYSFGTDERTVDAVLDDTHSIESVMTQEVTTLEADKPIRRAFEILSLGSFHALPITEDGDLVGIVTSTDLLRYALDQY